MRGARVPSSPPASDAPNPSITKACEAVGPGGGIPTVTVRTMVNRPGDRVMFGTGLVAARMARRARLAAWAIVAGLASEELVVAAEALAPLRSPTAGWARPYAGEDDRVSTMIH